MLQLEREEPLVPRTIVLAKLPGLPLLPGMIMGYDAVPFKVLGRRPPPRTAASYAVRFFPKGDYSWVYAEDLAYPSRPLADARIIQAARPNAWEASLHAAYTPAQQAHEAAVEAKRHGFRDDPDAIKIERWRRQLQAAFLTPEGLNEEDVPAMDELFDVLHTYSGMTLDYLLASKLAKVVRGIRFLEPQRLPFPDKFAFRQRANALIRKWQELRKNSLSRLNAAPCLELVVVFPSCNSILDLPLLHECEPRIVVDDMRRAVAASVSKVTSFLRLGPHVVRVQRKVTSHGRSDTVPRVVVTDSMSPKTQSRRHGPDAPGSAYPVEQRKYDRRDLVLAKIDLLPFLPGMIMDADDVPARIHKMRPKRNQDSTYAVRLFPKGDYYWVAERELEPLSREQISAFIAGTPDRGLDRRLYGVGKRRMLKAYVAPAAKNGIEQNHAAIGFATSGASCQLHSRSYLDSDGNNSEDERTVASMLRAAPAEVDALTEKQKLELAKDPEAIQVRRWRRELQQILLRKEDAKPSAKFTARLASPDEQAMIRLNDVLAQIETYENMTVDYLVVSRVTPRPRRCSGRAGSHANDSQFSKILKIRACECTKGWRRWPRSGWECAGVDRASWQSSKRTTRIHRQCYNINTDVAQETRQQSPKSPAGNALRFNPRTNPGPYGSRAVPRPQHKPLKVSAKGKKKKKTSRISLPAMGGEEELGAGEIVLAKIDLLPLLPGMIATDDELPDDMKRSRPSKSVSAPSSKKEEIFYPVRFFPKGNYAWASLDRISRLSPAHVAAFLEDRLSKDTNERLYSSSRKITGN
ncbi:hypothetical protein C8F01DRAFT_1093019 [Mycena amicta]|nr:hypothetical protein C8F01DRAFT_1093019 [Mycena amicta]